MTHKRGEAWRAIRNSPGIQISLYFLAFACLIGLYTFIFHGYYPRLENQPISWTESLLFVVESMTTVGYSELGHFTNNITMLLEIQIIISGVIMIFIVVPLLIAPFLTTLLAPTPPRRTPHALAGHTVIMGYNELTRALVDSLSISDHDILIIEQDKSVALDIAIQYRRQAYVIWGDYNDPATWSAAHIGEAGYVVICQEERLTANLILGIRELTRGKIVSIIDKLSFDRYLRYAGAEYVLSPKHLTGRILARHAVLNTGGDTPVEIPGLDRITLNHNHLSAHELRLITIPVVPGSPAIGKTLRELGLLEKYGVHVLFLWKSGTFLARPGCDNVADGTTSLFLFGKAEAIASAIQGEFNTDGITESHAVIAGFGDVGKAAYQELLSAGIPCKIVDAKHHGVDQVVGNAEDEEVLKEARIENAQICVVALNNDDINIFTTLMARNLNPGIRILARANEPSSVDKLYRAGADYVALLPTIAGQAIGRIVLSDTVTILLDLPDGESVIMKHVMQSNPRNVAWYTRKTGVRIIGIERTSRPIVMPESSVVLAHGDAIIAVGTSEQLKKFTHLL
jgi:Trk K+ transport system NAD-binding subunit